MNDLKQVLRENLIEFGLLPDNPIVDFDFAWDVGQLAQEICRLRDKNKEYKQLLRSVHLDSFCD